MLVAAQKELHNRRGATWTPGVEVAVDKNSTVVFPAPLMSTIGELGAFLNRETQSAGDLAVKPEPPAPVDGTPATPDPKGLRAALATEDTSELGSRQLPVESRVKTRMTPFDSREPTGRARHRQGVRSAGNTILFSIRRRPP